MPIQCRAILAPVLVPKRGPSDANIGLAGGQSIETVSLARTNSRSFGPAQARNERLAPSGWISSALRPLCTSVAFNSAGCGRGPVRRRPPAFDRILHWKLEQAGLHLSSRAA